MELDPSEAYRYRFGLEVIAIPGPSAAWLFAAVGRRSRRRSE
jgi:hypothetical protein